MFRFYEPKIIIRKAKRPKWKATRSKARLNALGNQMKSAITVDLKQGITTFKSKVDKEAVYQAWLSGTYDRIMTTIPFSDMGEDLSGATEAIAAGYTGFGEAGISMLPAPIQSELRYDVENPRIDRFISSRTGELVTNISNDTQTVIQDAVRRNFTEALDPRRVADRIVGSIGLLPQHALAVQNLERSMVAEGMPAPRISELTAQYEARLLDSRALIIARTETAYARNYGQLYVWQDAQNQGLLSTDSQKVWNVSDDPCALICDPMDGQSVGLAEAWVLPDGDVCDVPNEAHPNCFPAGHLILTKRGEIPIECVIEGDEVLTHLLRWRKVTQVMNRPWIGQLCGFSAGRVQVISTPEHPFFVNGQWLAASDLCKGDNVLQISSLAEVSFVKKYYEPSFFGKILKLGGVLKALLLGDVPSSVYFNRQHCRRNSKVDVVFPDRFQWNDFNAALLQFRVKPLLQVTAFPFSFDSPSLRNQNMAWPWFSLYGFMRSLCDLLSVTSRHFLVHKVSNLSQSPSSHSVIEQNPRDQRSTMFNSFRYALNSVSKFIRRNYFNFSSWINGNSLHESHCTAIAEVWKQTFSGVVFNLTVEEDHSFFINGIATHNCECFMTIELGSTEQDFTEIPEYEHGHEGEGE